MYLSEDRLMMWGVLSIHVKIKLLDRPLGYDVMHMSGVVHR